MKELTKAEEQIMQYLWKLEKAFLKDIVEAYPEPKPAYTTVSTVIRVLVKKKFIGFNTYGKVHEYFPLVKKKEYFQTHFKGIVGRFFNGSLSGFASYFTDDDNLNISELQEIKKIVDTKIQQLKDQNPND
ncbi:BlaI/MecI/CopY family transcriptional regulator [Rapidithrix thailandica]|uniref:BlaI/MecI/CopY family transcriptional regulator n=1 Tax=Rapidithrix thailandica TaxID=413964 RepID=A0AAW9S3J5_9BACT